MKFTHRKRAFDIVGSRDDDHIYQAIRRSGRFYEVVLLEYIARFVRAPSGVVIDVGANIGNHSVFFRSFVALPGSPTRS